MTAMAVRTQARNVRSFEEWSPKFLIILLISIGGESFRIRRRSLLISQTPCEHRGPSRPRQRPLDRRNRECVAERDFLQSVEASGRAGVPGVEIDAQHHGVA